jgi:hypothetical protein
MVALTWDERIAALEAGLRKLPLKSPRKPNAIPYSTTIPSIARELALLGGPEARSARNTMSGAATTRRELAAVQKAADSLLAVLDELHQPARTALDEMGPPDWIRWLTVRLTGLTAAAEHAKVPELRPTAGRGRPPKPRAHAIAVLTATHYARLTGEAPTARTPPANQANSYTPFMDLLATVFDALGVGVGNKISEKARVEGQARQAIRAWKKVAQKEAT